MTSARHEWLAAEFERHRPYGGTWLPEPVLGDPSTEDPEQDVLPADSIGLALHVVLEALTPRERIAFVLHDVFGMPFETIAGIVGNVAPRRSIRVRFGPPASRGSACPSGSKQLAHQERVPRLII